MKRRLPLTARGMGAIIVAAISLIVAAEAGVPPLVYFALLLLALVAAAAIWVYLPRNADAISRVLDPGLVVVDDEAVMRVHIGIRTQLPLPAMRWQDQMPPGLSALDSRRHRAEWVQNGGGLEVFAALGSAAALAPQQHATGVMLGVSSRLRGGERTVTVTYPVYGRRRGVHPVGPFTMQATDPFGLVRRTTVIRIPATPVTVIPAVIELAALHDSWAAAGGAVDTTITHLGQGADNLIARAYMPGDSMRRIHWRATAHRDQLMVRQEEQESNPEATVVLDRGVLRWSLDAMAMTGADAGFEMAVSTCASVLVRLLRDGYAVTVIDSDGTELIERLDAAAPGDLREAIRSLASIAARRDDHLTELGRTLVGSMLGPLVVITGRIDESDVATLATLARQSALPLLFAAAAGPGALERARAGGWRTGSIAPGMDLAQTWTAANGAGVMRSA